MTTLKYDLRTEEGRASSKASRLRRNEEWLALQQTEAGRAELENRRVARLKLLNDNALASRLSGVGDIVEGTAKWLMQHNLPDSPNKPEVTDEVVAVLNEGLGYLFDNALWQSARMVYEVIAIAREYGLDCDHSISALRQALDGTLYRDDSGSPVS